MLGPDPSLTLSYGLWFRSVHFWSFGVRQVSRSVLNARANRRLWSRALFHPDKAVLSCRGREVQVALPPPATQNRGPSCDKNHGFVSQARGGISAVSQSRHVCHATKQTCLLCLAADASAASHSRHVCCATQQTCMPCHTADMAAVPQGRHLGCGTQQTYVASQTLFAL